MGIQLVQYLEINQSVSQVVSLDSDLMSSYVASLDQNQYLKLWPLKHSVLVNHTIVQASKLLAAHKEAIESGKEGIVSELTDVLQICTLPLDS
jgi:hypothetical protein